MLQRAAVVAGKILGLKPQSKAESPRLITKWAWFT
jgi:hypothetical protein